MYEQENMATQFQKVSDFVQQSHSILDELASRDITLEQFDQLEHAVREIGRIRSQVNTEFSTQIEKMKRKASEPDVEKRIYGVAMTERVLNLAESFSQLEQKLIHVYPSFFSLYIKLY